LPVEAKRIFTTIPNAKPGKLTRKKLKMNESIVQFMPEFLYIQGAIATASIAFNLQPVFEITP